MIRYFNVIEKKNDVDLENIIKAYFIISESYIKKKQFSILGKINTKDGTAVRDYIHVDLSKVHYQ